MPHETHDRENLLAEATALVERVELRVTGLEQPCVIGFRRDHGASFYLAPERVYQFNSAGHLRRAFVDDLLYKAERGRLVSLTRVRGPDLVQMVRRELDTRSSDTLLRDMREHLERLHTALAKGRFQLVGQTPAEADIVGRIRCWLDEFAHRAQVADSPRAG